MLFLLNDVILNVDPNASIPPMDSSQFNALGLETVTKLGAELYASEPVLHHTNKARAMRLASLILLKAPQVNAALFLAPGSGCSPAQVASRYASLTLDILAGLNARQSQGNLTTVHADQAVWRRLAA